MSNLAKDGQDELLSRFEFTVLSKANPIPNLLRYVRKVVQDSPSVQSVLVQARAEGLSSEQLTTRLELALTSRLEGEGLENIKEVATYLADEHLQHGDGILLISNETGKAVVKLIDADFYQPAPIPRPNGKMVTPPKRVRPEIESFLTQWHSDRGREVDIQNWQMSRLPVTELLRELGDPRVRYSTYEGRKKILRDVEQQLPNLLESSRLIRYLSLGKSTTASTFQSLGEVTCVARATYPLQDLRAQNLRYDVMQSLLGSTASSWTRGVLEHISFAAKRDLAAEDITLDSLLHCGIEGVWTCCPDVAIALARLQVADLIPIGSQEDFVVKAIPPFGYIIPQEDFYKVHGREIFDRWEITLSFTANIWVDWELVNCYRVIDIPQSGLSFEVL